MEGYICNKACNFGGVAYNAGDTIPFEAVLPSRERTLINQGYITPANIAAEAPASAQAPFEPIAGVNVPIIAEEGTLELTLSPEGIAEGIRILQLNAKEAEKAIRKLEEEEILILIDALDERTTVRAAAKNRAQALMAMEELEEPEAEEEEQEEAEEETETEEGQEGDA